MKRIYNNNNHKQILIEIFRQLHSQLQQLQNLSLFIVSIHTPVGNFIQFTETPNAFTFFIQCTDIAAWRFDFLVIAAVMSPAVEHVE